MPNVSATALSGYRAAEERLAVAANNIANANSERYRERAVEQSALPSGGVSTRVVERAPTLEETAPLPTQGPSITPANGNGGNAAFGEAASPSDSTASNVSIERNLIEAKFATYSAQANLKIIETQSKLDKYLLDIQA